MTTRNFSQIMDRSRIDRLEAEILAFAQDLTKEGYSYDEIAGEMICAAFERAKREKWNYIAESFYHHVCQTTNRLLHH